MEFSLRYEDESSPHPFEFGEIIFGKRGQKCITGNLYMLHPAVSELIQQALKLYEKKDSSFTLPDGKKVAFRVKKEKFFLIYDDEHFSMSRLDFKNLILAITCSQIDRLSVGFGSHAMTLDLKDNLKKIKQL